LHIEQDTGNQPRDLIRAARRTKRARLTAGQVIDRGNAAFVV